MQTVIIQTVTIQTFLTALDHLTDSAVECGRILVQLVDQDPRVYEKILTARANIPLRLLSQLEKVGRGQFLDKLLWDDCPGARRLLPLTFAKQKEIYENPIPVVIEDKGKEVVVMKNLQQLTPKQAIQAIDENGIVPPEKQAEAVRERMSPKSAAPAQRYELLDNGNIIIRFAPTEFTPSQLQDIYERSKSRAIKSIKRENKP